MVRRWLAVAGGAMLLLFTCAGGQPGGIRSYVASTAERAAGGKRSIEGAGGILMGRVAQTGTDRVLIQVPGEPAVALRVGEGTRVLVEGELIPSGQLQPGMDVRVTYELIDGNPVADWIEATSPEQH